MNPVSRSRLAALFFRAGTFTFGGGNPTMAALYTDLVTVRGWLTAEQYGLVYALARLTPGTNLLAFGAGVGWMAAGWSAAALAVIGMSAPAAVCAVLLTTGYELWKNNGGAMAAIAGILAASVGLMSSSAWQLVAPHLKQRALRAILFPLSALILALRFQIQPIAILLLAALVGFLLPEREA